MWVEFVRLKYHGLTGIHTEKFEQFLSLYFKGLYFLLMMCQFLLHFVFLGSFLRQVKDCATELSDRLASKGENKNKKMLHITWKDSGGNERYNTTHRHVHKNEQPLMLNSFCYWRGEGTVGKKEITRSWPCILIYFAKICLVTHPIKK